MQRAVAIRRRRLPGPADDHPQRPGLVRFSVISGPRRRGGTAGRRLRRVQPRGALGQPGKGRQQAERFDAVWQELARRHSVEPFLIGTETPNERDLVAACVNRVLRNTRTGGNIGTPSMVEFFGPTWAAPTWSGSVSSRRVATRPGSNRHCGRIRCGPFLTHRRPKAWCRNSSGRTASIHHPDPQYLAGVPRLLCLHQGPRIPRVRLSKAQAWYAWFLAERDPRGTESWPWGTRR